MIDHIVEKSQQVAITSGSFTATSGTWAWLGNHSQAIGAVCAIIGVVLTLIALGVSWYYRHKNYKLNKAK